MERHSLVVFKSASFSKKKKIYNFKIHLLSFYKYQTNDGIFLNKSGDNLNLAKIFWNVRVRL